MGLIEKFRKIKKERKKTDELIHTYKALKKEKKSFIEEYTKARTKEDGRAHIEIDIREEEVTNSLSNKKIIDRSILDFIEEQASNLKKDSKISLDFLVDNNDGDKEKFIQNSLTRYFKIMIYKSQDEEKRIKAKAFIFLALGVLFCLTYILLSYFSTEMSGGAKLWSTIISEIIGIVYWVFIWEATDKWAFDLTKEKFNGLFYTQLYLAKVNFINLESEEKDNGKDNL